MKEIDQLISCLHKRKNSFVEAESRIVKRFTAFHAGEEKEEEADRTLTLKTVNQNNEHAQKAQKRIRCEQSADDSKTSQNERIPMPITSNNTRAPITTTITSQNAPFTILRDAALETWQKAATSVSRDLRYRLFYKYFGDRETVGYCLCCARRFTIVEQWHSSHIVARALGGDDALSNRVPLCAQCNNNDDNRQNLLDYVFRMKYDAKWLERLIRIVATSRQLFVEEERHKATFCAQTCESLHAYAVYRFLRRSSNDDGRGEGGDRERRTGSGEREGGVQEHDIFTLLQQHDDMTINVENARKRVESASELCARFKSALQTVEKEHADAEKQLSIAESRYRQFVE